MGHAYQIKCILHLIDFGLNQPLLAQPNGLFVSGRNIIRRPLIFVPKMPQARE
jgi:hypothetical protein